VVGTDILFGNLQGLLGDHYRAVMFPRPVEIQRFLIEGPPIGARAANTARGMQHTTQNS
jgi:hypothetical protein